MLTYEQLAETFPPGDVIKEELEERGWTQRDLADIMGVQPSIVSALVKGTKPISLDLARNLAAAFGNSAQFWVNMDTAYRLNLPSEKHDATSQRSELYKIAPVNEMIKRGWIESSADVDVLRTRVAKFFGKETIEEIESESVPFAARQGVEYATKLTAPQKAWVRRVKTLGRAVHAAKFRDDSVDEALKRLRPLMASPEEVRHIPRLLAECGIRLVVVEHLQQTRIDGVCLWLDDDSPVIAISMRYDRLDYFWFTLLHELGHVANRDGLAISLVPDCDLVGEQAAKTSEKPEIEQRVDRFAAENLIRPGELDSFIARVKPLFSKVKIHGFALRQGVHPAIVIGQLQHRQVIHWSHSREFLVKVREIITQSALTDGWGQILPNIA
ncbi:MAG: HigA family addiction module antitoxin [Candidatus Angelobacter sp.]